ncbi:MAG: hypothetical protein FWF82_03000, partial [Oscillospiraceae bacterium]|nr:hypothetical protein [Oscillospiraceae bacterium]
MNQRIRNMFYTWRFYTLRRGDYIECKKRVFSRNLYSLRLVNSVVAGLAFCFTAFPVFIEKDFVKACAYLLVSLFALTMALYSRRKYKQHFAHKGGKKVGNVQIYVLMTMFYLNAIVFGIFIGVWSNPDKLAVTFMGFLICALFLFTNPPIFNLFLTVFALIMFIFSTVMTKTYENYVFDIANALFAGSIGLIFTWQVNLNKFLTAFSAGKLEEERNSYYNQSTVDELTGLKNRRDFMQTFSRYLTNYRDNDNFLCLAI